MKPNLVVSLSALPKVGKNHFSYSAPDPIKVYCFNGGALFVASKFTGKVIEVKDYRLPIVESSDLQWAAPIWEDFRAEYEADLTEGKNKTYVFDTGTEIENICQQSVLEDQQDTAAARGSNKQKLATTEYLARNLRMKALFDMAKDAGVNLISLQYLKEEWIKHEGRDRAEPTGKWIFDGWKRTESQADINLEMKLSVDKKTRRQVSVVEIVSNRFDRDMNGQTFEDSTWDEITTVLVGE